MGGSFSLLDYRGMTLRFQTIGEIEAFMPANEDILTSGGHYTLDSYLNLRFEGTVVPIPASVWLFGSALAGLGWLRRKRSRLGLILFKRG